MGQTRSDKTLVRTARFAPRPRPGAEGDVERSL
jgi:hypothetical protein